MRTGPLGFRCAPCSMGVAAGQEDRDDEWMAGELFPELKIEGVIARGGFGSVFRAQHRHMKRAVALKFLDSVIARVPDAVAQFEREMIAVGGLDHPGIVRAHDAGERDGQWYIIMELVEGQDCSALMRKHGALPVAESCEIIRQAAVALHHAHGHGLVHRDVKPGNLMISRERTEGTERTKGTSPEESAVATVLAVTTVPSSVKVLDFGLAGLAVASVYGAPRLTGPIGEGSHSSLVIGTLEYAAPEQIEDPASVDARADIYGLGATLWRLLTGTTLHPAGGAELSLFQQMKKITMEPVPSIATVRPGLPGGLAKLCDRMLSLDREKRPSSGGEVAELIAPYCAGAELARLFTEGPLEEKPFLLPPRPRSKWWHAAAALAGGAVLAGMGYALYQAGHQSVPVSHRAVAGRPVFSTELTALRQLDDLSSPRFLTDEWETLSETPFRDPIECARFLPGGDLFFRNVEPNGYGSLQQRTAGFETQSRIRIAIPSPDIIGPDLFGVAPDSGFIIWTQRRDHDYQHLGRARPDFTRLASLTYDPGGDFEVSRREEMRKFRERYDEEDQERRPCGFAFVTAGQVPENTGLRAGDVLIADEGQRWLAPKTTPFGKDKHGLAGLWRCRFDDDLPASRLGEAPALISLLLDVAVSRSGVFVLNRDRVTTVGPVTEADRTSRVLRWDQAGFHTCTLSQPLYDPSGLAADPFSTDLYAIQGASIPTTSPAAQRLVRLRLTAPDHYEVEVVAERFGRLSICGVSLSMDGKRMIVTDKGNRVILVLGRRDRKD